MEQIAEMVQGNTQPSWRGLYAEAVPGAPEDHPGIPKPLAGITVTLRIKKTAGVLEKTATVVNPAAVEGDADCGLFDVTWVATDMDEVGTLAAEVEFTDTATGALIYTTPLFYFFVRAHL